MEAKDTVTRQLDPGLIDDYLEPRKWQTIAINELIQKEKEAQAEITFKAGQEAERQEWLLKTDPEKARDNFTKQIIERACAQGRKEVVEWLKAHDWYCIGITAKLKEWGVNPLSKKGEKDARETS